MTTPPRRTGDSRALPADVPQGGQHGIGPWRGASIPNFEKVNVRTHSIVTKE